MFRITLYIRILFDSFTSHFSDLPYIFHQLALLLAMNANQMRVAFLTLFICSSERDSAILCDQRVTEVVLT